MVLETLRIARKEYNYSVKNMSDILGISESYYYQIENGRRKLDYIMAARISAIFDLKPDEMFYHYFKFTIEQNKKVDRRERH